MKFNGGEKVMDVTVRYKKGIIFPRYYITVENPNENEKVDIRVSAKEFEDVHVGEIVVVQKSFVDRKSVG